MDKRPRDKQSMLIGLGFILLLFAWPLIIQRLWPTPKPTTPPVAEATNEVTRIPPVAAQTPEPQPVEELPVESPEPDAPRKSSEPRPAEQRADLENDFLRAEFSSYGGGILRVKLKKHTEEVGDTAPVVLNRFTTVPMGAVRGLDGFDEQTAYTLQYLGSAVRLVGESDDGLKLTKEFRLGTNYLIEGTFTLLNQGDQPLKAVRMEISMGTASAMVPSDTFDLPNVGWGDGKKSEFIDPGSFDKSMWARRPARSVVQYDDVRMVWAGLEDRFFCTLWMPKTPTSSLSATRKLVTRLDKDAASEKRRPTDYGLDAFLISPPLALAPGESYDYSFTLYTGPKEYHRIKALAQGQTAVMHWGFIEWMAEILLGSMNLIYKAVPNYFWVIILLTAIIKVLLWPLQQISNKKMKEMQALAPKITAIREKFKDDPQKMNMEVMKLYREHKVNPMAGCFPMLLQFPVFIGLFYMLRSAIELRGHGFLWIKDLSQPDTIAHLGGFALNPLPIVMGATMIWQMKMTPSTADPMQQRIMMLMPLMFLFFFYGTPSGLVLYWTVQNLFSILQMALTKHATPSTGGAPPAAVAKMKPVKPR